MKQTRILSLLLALVLCLGLLPVTALAEEPIRVVFYEDLSGGQDYAILAVNAEGKLDSFPTPPVRAGYTFLGWVETQDGPVIDENHVFAADTKLFGTWRADGTEDNNRTFGVMLDPAGGTVSPEKLDANVKTLKLTSKLPTPTRPGFTFKGWYLDGKLVNDDSLINSTAPILRAKWERTSKIATSASASPAKIEAGAKKVEVVLTCTTSGAAFDWRPLELILFGNGTPSDVESTVKSYINGNFNNVGLKLTDVMYQGDWDFNSLDDNAYPRDLYPAGVCPAPQLVLTFEGEAKSGTLTIDLSGGLFLQPVNKGENIVFTESSAQIFNSARVTIPVGSGNANGPYTVKFDLNYKDAKQSEKPKDQTVAKGQSVSLPDGSKLTPPSDAYEFYAWGLMGKDSKGEDVLYPWNESQAVTADMTLYAGWVRKGSAIVNGEAIDAKVDTTAKPSTTTPSTPAPTPAKTSFTDVAATSAFAPAIGWAVEKGITNGTTPTTFEPGKTCTRAQIVTFLWRAAGSPEPKSMEAEYADVTNTTAYFYKAVQWAAEMGMEESGSFKPGDPCTRGQAVYFIWKANESAKAKTAASFTDVPAGSLYRDAVNWAVEQEVTKGTGDGTTFSPDATCTRGQIVTFLYRAYEK